MLTLLRMTKKSLAKSCCGNCASGKPCCGDAPKIGGLQFEQRGGLLLPKRHEIKNALWGPSEPMLERLLRSLFPPWAQFDMSCLPCCGCTCDSWPDSLTATVVATTGGCGGNLGNTATLTEAGAGTPSDNTWGGSMTNVGSLTMACGSGSLGCSNGTEVALTSTGQCTWSAIRVCYTCDPMYAVFVATATGLTCCGGAGGTMTIEVTA